MSLNPDTLPIDRALPAPARFQLFLAIVTLLTSSVLLFARLDHYALWDDEAITALTAQGVLKTGDTSAILGDNIVAYRNGLLLRNFKDRATPPLQFYLAAPFLWLFGDSALAARLPFAICGLASVALILWWMHRDRASMLVWILMCLGILGNVSLFLFSRQSRYYGLTILLTVAVAYAYLHVRTRRGLVGHALLSTLLLVSNYMTFAAVSLAQLVDYVGWGRRRMRLSAIDWMMLLIPQLAVGAIVVSVWNPLRIADDGTMPVSWIQWRLTLLWWSVRDLNVNEFGVGTLLLAAPMVALVTRSRWLWRAIVALVVCVAAIALISPQAPSNTRTADVRYLVFLIPLCIAIGVLTLVPLARIHWLVPICVAIVAFNSNILHSTPFWRKSVPVRSTSFLYARELMNPPPEPFTPTAQWIRAHVRQGETIAVLPRHLTYPMMFHAPQAVYAGQIDEPAPKGLEALSPMHYRGRTWPDYFVLFAPKYHKVDLQADGYEVAEIVPVFGHDTFRPELFWREFDGVKKFDEQDRVFILRKRGPKVDFRL